MRRESGSVSAMVALPAAARRQAIVAANYRQGERRLPAYCVTMSKHPKVNVIHLSILDQADPHKRLWCSGITRCSPKAVVCNQSPALVPHLSGALLFNRYRSSRGMSSNLVSRKLFCSSKIRNRCLLALGQKTGWHVRQERLFCICEIKKEENIAYCSDHTPVTLSFQGGSPSSSNSAHLKKLQPF